MHRLRRLQQTAIVTIVCCAALAWPGALRAAESSPQASPQSVTNPALHGAPSALEDSLRRLRTLRFSADDAALERAFAELMQRKYAAGWPSLYPHSQALERDGNDALGRGNVARALRLYEFARDLAPSRTGPRAAVVWLRLRHEPTAIGQLARDTLSLVKVTLTDYRSVTAFLANLLAGLFLLFAAAPFIVLVGLLVRHARYVAHDVTLLLPKGSSRLLGYALLVLLIGLPVALRIGAIGVAFMLLLIPFLHQDTHDRIAASVAFVLLLCLPVALEPMVRVWTSHTGRAADLYAVTHAALADDAKLRLEGDLKRKDAADVRLALGLYAKRHADLAAAQAHLQQAVKLAPERADAWVNLGAVHFLSERYAEADAAFKKAIALDARSIPALFNGSRMLYRASEAEKGTQLLTAAQELAPERTNALVQMSRMIGGRFMVEDGLKLGDYWRSEPYPTEQLIAGAAAASVAPYMTGGAPSLAFVGAGLGWLVLCWALAVALRRVRFALPCPRCGRPICLRTDKDLPDRSLCGQCYHAFVLQDVDTSMRIAKEVECRRHDRQRGQLVVFTSIMVAGLGHLLRGRALGGAALVWGAVATWVLALTAVRVIPLPIRTGSEQPAFLLLAVAGLVWLLLTVAALITVPKKD